MTNKTRFLYFLFLGVSFFIYGFIVIIKSFFYYDTLEMIRGWLFLLIGLMALFFAKQQR
ncbi:hypothetical protein HNR43_000328 [Anoxybacillus mongoliensis]|uniref:Uncharacterized protein n=1 Tax=Anoxybacillus mongoliensis TaxID=452565 RepID=A0A7W8N7G7_9BACL|nr:hypothetical protein [Anoxybacillus mongoliensis]